MLGTVVRWYGTKPYKPPRPQSKANVKSTLLTMFKKYKTQCDKKLVFSALLILNACIVCTFSASSEYQHCRYVFYNGNFRRPTSSGQLQHHLNQVVDTSHVLTCPGTWQASNSTVGILYTRIPKTGSSSVKVYFGRFKNTTYGQRDVCYHCTGVDRRIQAIVEKIHDLHKTGNFVFTGHIRYISKNLLPPQTLLMATVRHPILKKRSEYQYFWPRSRVGNYSECLCTNTTSFEECVLHVQPKCYEKVLGLQHTYVQYFCGHGEICTREPGSEEAHAQAVRNLDNYDLIGITEDLQSFFTDIQHMVPFEHIDGRVPNVKQSGVSALNAEVVKTLLAYNVRSTELKLYREILRRYLYRRGFCGIRNGLLRAGAFESDIGVLINMEQ